uniref:Uncharacterized protein n=1 Tax=Anguilla anguilla TaxID=7936 RepID=A0A0E9SAP0_ANGAN
MCTTTVEKEKKNKWYILLYSRTLIERKYFLAFWSINNVLPLANNL